jgi:hypothetical protein
MVRGLFRKHASQPKACLLAAAMRPDADLSFPGPQDLREGLLCFLPRGSSIVLP